MQTKTVEKISPDSSAWLGVHLTESAARQVSKMTQRDGTAAGVRLSIKKSGCVGFGYAMDLVHEVDETDLVYEKEGARLYVPLKAIPFIDGTELDYVREGLNQVFKFNNPNVQHECGCGESFNI